MTTVFGCQCRDEWGAPARHETVVRMNRAETREQRVNDPKFITGPSHFVGLDLARRLAMTTYRSATEFGRRFAGDAVLRDSTVRFPVDDYLAACEGLERGAILCGHVHRRY